MGELKALPMGTLPEMTSYLDGGFLEGLIDSTELTDDWEASTISAGGKMLTAAMVIEGPWLHIFAGLLTRLKRLPGHGDARLTPDRLGIGNWQNNLITGWPSGRASAICGITCIRGRPGNKLSIMPN